MLGTDVWPLVALAPASESAVWRYYAAGGLAAMKAGCRAPITSRDSTSARPTAHRLIPMARTWSINATTMTQVGWRSVS
jgi:hypothetical protein